MLPGAFQGPFDSGQLLTAGYCGDQKVVGIAMAAAPVTAAARKILKALVLSLWTWRGAMVKQVPRRRAPAVMRRAQVVPTRVKVVIVARS